MKTFTARDLSRLLELTVEQVRSYARAGLVAPERGPDGELRFSFQDLVLLRTTQGLIAARVPPRRLRRALQRLKQQLPDGRPLSGVQISAVGDRILVQDGAARWSPESGQSCFDFEGDPGVHVTAYAPRAISRAEPATREPDAEEWFELGVGLEATAPDQARDALRRALEIDPHHASARRLLGVLLQAAGQTASAGAHFRLVLLTRPADAAAWLGLGTCLEAHGELADAVRAYRATLEADPSCAEAHYRLAEAYEKLNDPEAALCHLRTYRQLTDRG